MFKNLIIIGTSHIAEESVNKINQSFKEFNPDVIAIELDSQRFMSLMNNEQQKLSFYMIRKVGLSGFIFLIIGRYIQNKLGSIVKIKPGADMKTAATLAIKNKKELLFIDRNIGITLKRFSKAFNFKEKIRVVIDLFKGFFQRKKRISIDITKVPQEDTLKILMSELKKNYPNLYNVLITERNNFMAKKVFKFMKANPEKKLMCIIGAGHEKGFNKRLKDLYYSNP